MKEITRCVICGHGHFVGAEHTCWHVKQARLKVTLRSIKQKKEKPTKCSLCEKKLFSKSLCTMHYTRSYRQKKKDMVK